MSEMPAAEQKPEATPAGSRRVLWVVPVADLGGVARHVLDVTRVGIPGWCVTVLCPEGALADRLRAQQVDVVSGPFGPRAGALTSMRTLRRAAAGIRPEIVHSHLAYADIINAWTPLPSGTRRFTTEHGIAGDDGVYHRSSLQSRLMALVHRARFPRFDGVIAVAEATRRAMIQKWSVRQPITVILNGVDLPATEKTRTSEIATRMRILSLSRLAPEKRIDKLIEAFALVRRQRPDATLTIAGEGPLRQELETMPQKLGIAESVRFPGYVNADAAMAEADVIVQLSVWENCSYTLLDGVARGLRIVAPDVGGNREVLGTDGVISAVEPTAIAGMILPTKTTAQRDSQSVATNNHPPVQPVAEMCRRIAVQYDRGGPND